MSNRSCTRRAVLGRGGAAIAGVSAGLAGCIGSSGGGGPDSLTLGTLNVFPMMQYFVIEQQGWYDDLGPEIGVQTFGGGPPLVQAYASGELDFAYVGISPGLVAIANGVASKVVAANVVEPNVMVGSRVYTTGELGQEGHHAFDTEAMKREEPTYVVFNGEAYAFTDDRYGALHAETHQPPNTRRVFSRRFLIASWQVVPRRARCGWCLHHGKWDCSKNLGQPSVRVGCISNRRRTEQSTHPFDPSTNASTSSVKRSGRVSSNVVRLTSTGD